MPDLLPGLPFPTFMVRPPSEPNVWGDGSKVRANSGHFSTSSFGMWEPMRIASSLTPPELEFMEVATLPVGISNGTVTSGVLAGRLGSSTRAELAVGVAALARPFPVHLATDSRAFCDKACAILDEPECWPRRPYALQRDGDLWQLLHERVIARGPNSLRISWQKAHASLDAIYYGAVRSDHAVHNSVADYAASKGDEACGRVGLVQLCSYHAHKQRAYIKLMIDINMLLTRVMQHDHALRASRKLAAKLGLFAGSQPAEEAPPSAYSCPARRHAHWHYVAISGRPHHRGGYSP